MSKGSRASAPAAPHSKPQQTPAEYLASEQERIIDQAKREQWGALVRDFLRSDGLVILTFENGHEECIALPRHAVPVNPMRIIQ
jgi:hypothetical protein